MASDAAAQNVPPNSTNDPIKPAARFAFVDGLRGLAALGIALYHTWRYEPAMTTNPLTYASNDLVRLLCREPCGRTSVVCVRRGSERPVVHLAEESPSAITVQARVVRDSVAHRATCRRRSRARCQSPCWRHR